MDFGMMLDISNADQIALFEQEKETKEVVKLISYNQNTRKIIFQ